MGIFNRRLTWDNRIKIARELGGILGMEELERQTPRSLAGIPILNNQNSWFFPYEEGRDGDHIDALWQVFADAVEYADDCDETNRASFIDSFNDAVNRKQVGKQLTFGLFWIRPQSFVSLDKHACSFIKKRLSLEVLKSKPDAETYLTLCDNLRLMFNDESMPVHSFPELSAMAWDTADEKESDTKNGGDQSPPRPAPYSVNNIVEEGCFLEQDRLEAIVERWRDKKNLILQGPPGTGKTWLAEKLAFALIGNRSLSRVRSLQFHPNLSYEDFVRGWRPSGDKERTLDLVDGPFLSAVEDAKSEPARDFVVVIDEIVIPTTANLDAGSETTRRS